MKPVGSVAVLGDFFKLTYAENTGVAFSQFQGKLFFILGMTCICFVILYFALKSASTAAERLGYWLIISGAAGNLIDRIRLGYVIDFLDFDFPDITIPDLGFLPAGIMERWPVFNFADSYVFIGVFIVMSGYFWDSYRKSGKT